MAPDSAAMAALQRQGSDGRCKANMIKAASSKRNLEGD